MQRLITIVALGFIFTSDVRSETGVSIRITRFDATGQLTWTNLEALPGVYAVERSPKPTGSWSELPGFSSVTSTSPVETVTVPLNLASNSYYRVVWKALAVADSLADFSGVQGNLGWYYGYYDTNATFTLLPRFGAWINGFGVISTNWNLDGTNSWLLLDASSCHPEGTNCGRLETVLSPVRRWVSTVQGPTQIFATVSGGNGVVASIRVDGALVATAMPADAGGQTNFTVATEMSIGSIIDCVLAPGNGNECFDYTYYRVTIGQ